MELADIVQNKILERRRVIFGNHIVFEYADYLLKTLAQLARDRNWSLTSVTQTTKLSRIIYNIKHDFFIGKISESEARTDLEYLAQKIESIENYENRKNI